MTEMIRDEIAANINQAPHDLIDAEAEDQEHADGATLDDGLNCTRVDVHFL